MAHAKKIRKITPHTAGIDIGTEKIFVCVEGQPVRSFDTFTATLHQARDYLLEHAIETVAMEATGVYWIPLYEILEAAGLEVCLVNGAHVKNVPGRKSDVMDCEWIQELHSYGLLRASFIPDAEIRGLRCYVRLRQDHIEMAASHIQHLQKALDLMNLKLHRVISQIQGKSGLAIIEAIVAGEREAEVLVELCDRRILNRKREAVLASLEGPYRAEHVFALKQALECYRFYQEKLLECDRMIEALLEEMTAEMAVPDVVKPPKAMRHNAPDIADLHVRLLQLTGGQDLAHLVGLTDHTVMKLLSETGTDISKWPTEKHFTSWAGLAPGSDQSGKRRRRRRRRHKNRVGQIFRECAQSVGQSKHLALGGFHRRLRARRGVRVATVATARKLAVLYYRMLKYGFAYVEQGLQAYEQQYQQQQIRYLRKKAKALGFEVVAATG